MNAGEVFKLACRVYDTAREQGQKHRDPAVSTEEYAAAQRAASDALQALAKVLYDHFPVGEEREVTP